MNWFISLASLVLMFLVQPETDIYAQAMAVVEVTDEWVICVDFDGNEWSFENSSKDWYVGDIASCVVSNNGTEEIFDDVILSASYDGWVEKNWGYDSESDMPIVTFD